MSEAATLLMYMIITCLCLWFLLSVLDKLWWSPRRIQKVMASQGIRGPSYRFLHGNAKEMDSMKQEAMATPMELSHHVFPRVMPDIYSCIKLYGTIYLQWFGHTPQLVIAEPELIKVILSDREPDYPKDDLRGHAKKLLGDGLVSSKGEKWHKQRKIADRAFHGESLKGMAPNMVASVETMLQRWISLAGKEIDAFEEFKLLTSEVISRAAFGDGYLEGENVFYMLTKLAHIVSRTAFKIKIPVIGRFFKTGDDIEADKLEQRLRDSIVKVKRTREERVESGKAESYGSDFLGSLLSAYHSDDKNKKISLDDVVDECKTFCIAGQETTLSLLSWIVLLLAINTEWQDKARKEVLESFGQEHPNPLGVARLKIMGMLINETLRLYPSIIYIIREVEREVSLGDIIVPANMNIHISILALQHSTKIWGEDAHMFKPERFAEGVAKATNNNIAAYIPFGLGPRNCVGNNFAINETKIALSMILQRYKFTLSPNYMHSPAHIVTLRPQHGLQIILHKL